MGKFIWTLRSSCCQKHTPRSQKAKEKEVTLRGFLRLYCPPGSCRSVADSSCGTRAQGKTAGQSSAPFLGLGRRIFSLEKGASVLTPQPCGWLSGCARRLKEPARVYPSGPGATPAPPASLVDREQGQGSRVKVTAHRAPGATGPEGLTIKGEVADEFGGLVAAGRVQERQQLGPELPQISLLLPRSNSCHSCRRRVPITGQNQAAVPASASFREETYSLDQR